MKSQLANLYYVHTKPKSWRTLKPQQNKKVQNLFEMPTKNDVFFTAGSQQKDIIFGGHLKQISALHILSEL